MRLPRTAGVNGSGNCPIASLTEFAPAKINLFLHVVGRRADGYHELDSLIAFADCHDVIRVDPGKDLTLTIEGPFGDDIGDIADNGDNLVLRAARALIEIDGMPRGAAITLVKNLPVASGIGGGSADAAATLRALIHHWNLNLSPKTLATIGLSLGADVPVCLFGRPARVQGIGEQISAADPLPDVGLVLVNPGIAVSTKEVFAARQGAFSHKAHIPPALCTSQDLVAVLADTQNDLAPPAIGLSPQIAMVLDQLVAHDDCLLARLSGSGATCFGLYSESDAATRAARSIKSENPTWWVHAGRFLATDTPLSMTEEHQP